MGSSTVEHISRVTETGMYKAVVLSAGAAELEILIYFMSQFCLLSRLVSLSK